jgi:hypothetical protein
MFGIQEVSAMVTRRLQLGIRAASEKLFWRWVRRPGQHAAQALLFAAIVGIVIAPFPASRRLQLREQKPCRSKYDTKETPHNPGHTPLNRAAFVSNICRRDKCHG